MADNNDLLDDFFAKKDKSSKKKGKSKSKIVVSDLMPASTPTPPNEPNENIDKLTEQISEAKIDNSSIETPKDRKKHKKKKDKDGTDASSRKEDDEWNEVNDAVDYSGLRIATKNIAKEAADEAAEYAARSEPEYDEDGQLIEKTKDETVWKIPESQQESHTAEPPAPAPVIVEMPNVSDNKYVPPSKRAGAASGTTDLAPVSLRRPHRKKTAPNMNSQEDFPSLGAAPAPVDQDVSRFEKVRGGGSSQQSHTSSGPSRLETSNMYSALDRR